MNVPSNMPQPKKSETLRAMHQIVHASADGAHDVFLHEVLSTSHLSKKAKEQLGDVYDKCTSPPIGSFADREMKTHNRLRQKLKCRHQATKNIVSS